MILVPAYVLGFYVRVPSWAVLAYVALVPWTLLYTDDRRTRARRSGRTPSARGSTWIALYPGVLLVRLVHAAVPGPGVLLDVAARSRRCFVRSTDGSRLPRALTVPLIWVGGGVAALGAGRWVSSICTGSERDAGAVHDL